MIKQPKLIVGILLCGMTLAYFMHRYPLTLPYAEDPELAAEFTLRDNGASALMIVDTIVIKRSWDERRFSQADFSYAWQSILEKQIGYFDIINVDQLTAGRLDSSSFIVCTESVISSSAWERWSERILNLPENTIVILDIDDSPSASLKTASPQSRIPCVNFARNISTIRQGAPAEDMTVVNRHTALGASDKLESNDLIVDSDNLNSDVPAADLLSLYTFNSIAETLPFPRWHTVPEQYSGIFLMTHDDEGIGDPGLWMNKFESSLDYTSTTFLLPSQTLSTETLEQMTKLGGSAALHWNRFDRFDKGSYDTLALGRWKPLKRKNNLQKQLNWLTALNGDSQGHIKHNRNHYFLWDDSYSRTFRILEAHGITMDFSYGPDLKQKGYLFGSAFPFHPLDENGAAFDLYETPVTWTENFAGADTTWISKILSQNAESFHGVIVPLYHNNTFDWRPDYDIYQSWRSSYAMAEELNYMLATTAELERFLQNRRESQLQWTLGAGQLTVECLPQDSGLALLVPQSNLGRPRITTQSGKDISDSECEIDQVQLMNASYWRITVPALKLRITCDRLEESIQQR